jgi:arsenite methyltransferase
MGHPMPTDASEKALRLREAVRKAYSAASENPEAEHPFPVGRDFALRLGYPPSCLASLPAVSVEAFSGVSNVSVFAEIPDGARVLDLGCGAGLDSLIAGQRAGPRGTVVGVDFSEEMLARARNAAAEARMANVCFCRAAGEALPVKDGSIDVALVNGIFNLNPWRDAVFAELARVVRPGGAAYAAELILREPLPPEVKESEADWFA